FGILGNSTKRRAANNLRPFSQTQRELDADAVVAGQRSQTTSEALADSLELPLTVVAIDLTEDHCGLNGGVLAQVKAGNLAVVLFVQDADIRFADLTEVLVATSGVVDRDAESQFLGFFRQAGQVDVDSFVVAFAFTRAVVAVVNDVASWRGLVVVEDERVVAQDFFVLAQHEYGGVQVKLGAVGGARVPA